MAVNTKPCSPVRFSVSQKLPNSLANKRGLFANRMFYTGKNIHLKIWKPDELMREHSSEHDLIKTAWLKAKGIAHRDKTEIELFIEYGYFDSDGFFWTRSARSLGKYCGEKGEHYES